jgi:tetratricopeptide (TPR) repeat protein
MRSRHQRDFVGREGQLVQYQENLGVPVDDERRRFLFNIHGNAGVGKTYLVKQLRQIAAESQGCLTTYVDETIDDAVSAMTVIAEEVGRAGARLSKFEKRAAAYQERRHAMESDPQAPPGVAAFITKAAVIAGLAAVKEIPVAGSLLAPFDPAVVADQANQARLYLARKFSDHADVRLLLSPVDELAPIFVSEIGRAVAGRPIAFFFDTYERTAPLLDSWLRRMYDGRYGDLPANLVTTVAGQHPLNPNLWGDYLSVIADIPLEPFSDTEARQYLASKNVHEKALVERILTLSGCLPMWLATLARSLPADSADIGDPASSAAEFFLRSEHDPARRSTALSAALPRTFNRDILAVITPPGQAPQLFGWLCGMPFVSQQGSSWAYHQVVRSALLRQQQAQAPSQWRASHVLLAKANARWAREAADTANKPWANGRWVDYTREETYHLLCADPAGNLSRFLTSAVSAAEHGIIRARQWADLISDAGRDTGDAMLRDWGQRLSNGVSDSDVISYLSHLINDAHLDEAMLAVALEQRGEGHRLAVLDQYAEALADLSRAVELNPNSATAFGRRGQAYKEIGWYDLALADFDRSVEIKPDSWSIGHRGQTYRLLRQYEDALADSNNSVELAPSNGWAITGRGKVYQDMGRHKEALADFERVIELDPHSGQAVANRAGLYQAMGRYDEALADFGRAIELAPDDGWVVGRRGQAHTAMGRYEEAVADFNRSVELNPIGWSIGSRGQTYRLMGRYEEALADSDRTVKLDPYSGWALVNRGEVYLAMGRYEEAVADFDRAAELDHSADSPYTAWNVGNRGHACLALGRHEEALTDLTHAIRIEPEQSEYFAARGKVHQAMGRQNEAMADFSRAVELDPSYQPPTV